MSCSDDNGTNVPPADTPEATIEGSTFGELQGYENAADGFTTLDPGNLGAPIYIQERRLAGASYLFAADNASRLDGMSARPGEDGWSATAAIAAGCVLGWDMETIARFACRVAALTLQSPRAVSPQLSPSLLQA